MVEASGEMEDFLEDILEIDGVLTATCWSKRKNRPTPVERRFSIDDAKRASLWGKSGPWSQYPKRMLQMRARWWVLKDLYSDVLKGLKPAEEAMDYIDITPEKNGKYSAKPAEPEPPIITEAEAKEEIERLAMNNYIAAEGLIEYLEKSAKNKKIALATMWVSIREDEEVKAALVTSYRKWVANSVPKKKWTGPPTARNSEQWEQKATAEAKPEVDEKIASQVASAAEEGIDAAEKMMAEEDQGSDLEDFPAESADDGTESTFRSEWINIRSAGFSTYVHKNLPAFYDADEALLEEAKQKWTKFYPNDPFPTLPVYSPLLEFQRVDSETMVSGEDELFDKKMLDILTASELHSKDGRALGNDEIKALYDVWMVKRAADRKLDLKKYKINAYLHNAEETASKLFIEEHGFK